MKYILGLLLLSSCGSNITAVGNNYNYKEDSLANGVYRYETNEVICYTLFSNALQCKWKDK